LPTSRTLFTSRQGLGHAAMTHQGARSASELASSHTLSFSLPLRLPRRPRQHRSRCSANVPPAQTPPSLPRRSTLRTPCLTRPTHTGTCLLCTRWAPPPSATGRSTPPTHRTAGRPIAGMTCWSVIPSRGAHSAVDRLAMVLAASRLGYHHITERLPWDQVSLKQPGQQAPRAPVCGVSGF
jgi:hypothetical protein